MNNTQERNLKEETPLHTAARCGNKTFVDSILEIGEDELLQMERLLAETDKERNTVFHLAAKKNQEYVKADIDGTAGSNVLKSLIYFLKDTQQIEPAKVLSFKNDKDKTPFSEAVAYVFTPGQDFISTVRCSQSRP